METYQSIVRIIAKSTLRAFWERHPDAKGPLESWHKRVQQEDWQTPDGVTALWPRASIVGRDRVVFRIKGNDYRLVVSVFYRGGQVFVKFVGTHAEYDQIDVEKV